MTNELSRIQEGPAPTFWTEERKTLAHKTWGNKITAEEFEMFMMVCAITRLDPFLKQLIPVVRQRYNKEKKGYEKFMVIQTTLDALCVVAERTGKYEGCSEPQWCGKDGIWKSPWTADETPVAARIEVYKTGARVPTTGIVYYEALVQTYDGVPGDFWKGKKGVSQLEKCALAKALRRAFPHDCGKIYIAEEMAQAESPTEEGTRLKDEAAEDFLKDLDPEVGQRLAKVGFDNEAKVKTLYTEAGSYEGLVKHLAAAELVASLPPDILERFKFCGFKNSMEQRRQLLKVGGTLEALKKYLEADPVQAEAPKASALPSAPAQPSLIPKAPTTAPAAKTTAKSTVKPK